MATLSHRRQQEWITNEPKEINSDCETFRCIPQGMMSTEEVGVYWNLEMGKRMGGRQKVWGNNKTLSACGCGKIRENISYVYIRIMCITIAPPHTHTQIINFSLIFPIFILASPIIQYVAFPSFSCKQTQNKNEIYIAKAKQKW